MNKWPVINTVVMEFSFAEINGVLNALNKMDIVKYLNIIYEMIQTKTDNWDIVKFHLCVSHLMHNMTSDVNNNFRIGAKGNTIIKEIIASFYLIGDYEEIKGIWKHLCIVLKSKHINQTLRYV